MCEVWGILNVTPDSFSDGGHYFVGRSDEVDRAHPAVRRALEMREQGADVIDVGGASSRPPGQTYGLGASEVSVEEELNRVVPVVAALRREKIRVSVDTTKAEVAEAALRAGASIVNDVSMGRSAALLAAVARHGGDLVLMHTRENGRVEGSTYGRLVEDVITELESAILRAVSMGVPASAIWVDPGIGFAKTARQSAELLGAIAALKSLNHRVLVGASRKSWIAKLAPGIDEPSPMQRLGGSLAAATTVALDGADAVRVHDVAESKQAVMIALAIRSSRTSGERSG